MAHYQDAVREHPDRGGLAIVNLKLGGAKHWIEQRGGWLPE